MIRTRTEAGVGYIMLNRPERRNALNTELMDGLTRALAESAEDDAVRVVVLGGEGKAFCAGADLTAMSSMGDVGSEENRADALAMGRVFHRVAENPKPVVGRVQGPVIGGGLGLMAACDIVVTSSTVGFQFSEVRLGLVPAMISPICMARIGASAARRLFLTGERIDATEALRIGLVDVVADPESLDSAVAGICGNIAKGGPKALRAAKELVRDVQRLRPDEVLDHTSRVIADMRVGEEALQGMQSFLGKVPAPWVPGVPGADGEDSPSGQGGKQ